MRVATPVLFQAGTPHRVVELDVDEPRAGEVRVRMAASGVCHSCLYTMNGQHTGIPMPIVLGDEGAGVVESVGPGVTSVAEGDHVIVSWAPGCGRCRTCLRGAPALCTAQPPLGRMADHTTRFHLDGAEVFHYGPATNAPLTVLNERAVVTVDPRIPLDLAALIGCAAATGVGAVRNTARVRTGESMVVVGCGGVGISALHAGALAGAYPIVAVDVVPEKFPALTALGATHCVDATADDAAERILDITGGGVDYAFVTSGAPSAFPIATRVLAAQGTCVLIAGYPDGATLSFDPGHLLNGERRIIASKYGSSNPPVDFPDLVDLYLAGRLRLDDLVSGRWRIDQVDEAYDALSSGTQTRGLIVFA
ncbi:alcohol dehydrogenase catalytic domain-containing protein [Streptosporangium sp. NBC_01755]|uniref:zinc-binding dehydrogenase n=1 Tax=unclassified Streptosporangium TaxID=2632669 RepID=UPI002DD8800C|nr:MULTISPECIES: zinc-binding dehydrogenase [unclassified Streptosporangium]WSA24159.1 alcohol dehydrogenase catalytic domain-containing protein [Streptosporangium sp. NBC_01810]WSC97767.1 alcohol dehydrogenase catalytic domain-containing protein [Streptosporangium sp. NBC_01755]